MDANSKVTKYLADLHTDGSRRKNPRRRVFMQCGDYVHSVQPDMIVLQTRKDEFRTSHLLIYLMPTKAAHDPLQFVSTSAASMAESARQLISITEQQKRERAKLLQHGSPIKDDDTWQEDLDTWRRKRKTKVAKQDSTDSSSPARDYRPAVKEYHSLPGYGRMHTFPQSQPAYGQPPVTAPMVINRSHGESIITGRTADDCP